MSLLLFACGNMVTRFLDAKEAAAASGAATNKKGLKQRRVTINNATISQLTNFPLPVFLNTTRINYTIMQSAGQDLRFYDSDGITALSYEIERWDASGTSLVWVKVPQIDANSTTDGIVMEYGSSIAVAGANSSAVWSSEYRNVYHLNNGNDSTANANHVTTNTNVNFFGGPLFGGLASFTPASNPSLLIPINGLSTTTGATIEAIVELATTSGGVDRYAFSHTAALNERLYLGAGFTSTRLMSAAGSTTGTQAVSASYTLGTPAYVVVVMNGPPPSTFDMYLNGVLTDSTAYASHTGFLTSARIGNYAATPSTTDSWNGYIYEMRVINGVKSADYIKANSRAITDAYLTFGAEEDN